MTNFDEYQEAAARTMTDKMPQIEAALGLAGECGEVVDLVKKIHFQGRALNREELAEEIGDVCWYIAALATAHELSLGEIAAGNIAKLRARYPDGFVKGGGVRESDDGKMDDFRESLKAFREMLEGLGLSGDLTKEQELLFDGQCARSMPHDEWLRQVMVLPCLLVPRG